MSEPKATPPYARTLAKAVREAPTDADKKEALTKLRAWAAQKYPVDFAENLTLEQVMHRIGEHGQKILDAKRARVERDVQEAVAKEVQAPARAAENVAPGPVRTEDQPWPGAEMDPEAAPALAGPNTAGLVGLTPPAPGAVGHAESISGDVPENAQGLPQKLKQADPSKPLDPYIAAGLKPGGRPNVAQRYDEKGSPLLPDSSPVLPESEAFRQGMMTYQQELEPDPFQQGAFGAPGRQASPSMPHGPAEPPRRFRHPQNTTFLFNPRTGLAFRPTEILMRRPDLQPLNGPLPDGVYFGG